jgi:lambda family phage minor tail protein L
MAYSPRDGQTLQPSTMIELFELDLNPIGIDTVYRFTNQKGNGFLPDARFNDPRGIVTAPDGSIYVSDTGNHTIRKISPRGIVTTIAGKAGVTGTTDGEGSAARFNGPFALALDASGNLFVSDRGNNLLRKITPDGTVSTVALTMAGPPQGICADRTGNIYVLEFNGWDSKLHVLAPNGTITEPYIGSTGDNNILFYFHTWNFWGVSCSSENVLHLANSSSHIVYRYQQGIHGDIETGALGTYGSADGNKSNTRLRNPYATAVDASDVMYVADGHGTIRKVSNVSNTGFSTSTTSTIAGAYMETGHVDGTGTNARFGTVYAITMGLDNSYLYATDSNHTIRKIMADGSSVATVAGLATSSGASDTTDGVVLWKGDAYTPWPILASEFEASASGVIPRPKIRIGTLGSLPSITNLVRDNGDLVGATITRRRTLQKYLDAINFDSGINENADPLWELVDVYQVAQKSMESPQEGYIEWELRSAIDMEGKLIPKRIIQAGVCGWKPSDTDVCAFVATCDRRLATCRTNHPTAALPYGGFPGSALVGM